MKKPALIRSDKPHAVHVSEGSSVAQRQSTGKKTATPKTPEPLENIQLAPAVKAGKTRKALAPKVLEVTEPLPPPEPAKAPQVAHPTKAKRKAKPALKKAVRPPPKKSPENTSEPAQAVLPELPALPVWEKDNPIKARIEELQALNAQLSEQLQRLTHNRPARGATP